MSLLGKFSFTKLVDKLSPTGDSEHTQEKSEIKVPDETAGEAITLERIKDLISDAYSALDENKKVLLLERADRLETQLVQKYRARGLKVTADNICNTLEDHRKRFHNH